MNHFAFLVCRIFLVVFGGPRQTHAHQRHQEKEHQHCGDRLNHVIVGHIFISGRVPKHHIADEQNVVRKRKNDDDTHADEHDRNDETGAPSVGAILVAATQTGHRQINNAERRNEQNEHIRPNARHDHASHPPQWIVVAYGVRQRVHGLAVVVQTRSCHWQREEHRHHRQHKHPQIICANEKHGDDQIIDGFPSNLWVFKEIDDQKEPNKAEHHDDENKHIARTIQGCAGIDGVDIHVDLLAQRRVHKIFDIFARGVVGHEPVFKALIDLGLVGASLDAIFLGVLQNVHRVLSTWLQILVDKRDPVGPRHRKQTARVVAQRCRRLIDVQMIEALDLHREIRRLNRPQQICIVVILHLAIRQNRHLFAANAVAIPVGHRHCVNLKRYQLRVSQSMRIDGNRYPPSNVE
mmetsp:Transcript_41263/g.67871  ORF Transcript_41263/g.67871 Transcript_41263/m.67871 type:complete len:407 (-) Transcript_41263:125-1345(-)